MRLAPATHSQIPKLPTWEPRSAPLFSVLTSVGLHGILWLALGFHVHRSLPTGGVVEFEVFGASLGNTTPPATAPQRRVVKRAPTSDAPQEALDRESAPVESASGIGESTQEVDGSAGEAGSLGFGGETDPYVQKLRTRIQQFKVYPEMARRLGLQGVVRVQFQLDREGRLIDLEIVGRAPFEELNNAAVELVRRLDGYAPFPEDVKLSRWTFTVPIEYRL